MIQTDHSIYSALSCFSVNCMYSWLGRCGVWMEKGRLFYQVMMNQDFTVETAISFNIHILRKEERNTWLGHGLESNPFRWFSLVVTPTMLCFVIRHACTLIVISTWTLAWLRESASGYTCENVLFTKTKKEKNLHKFLAPKLDCRTSWSWICTLSTYTYTLTL